MRRITALLVTVLLLPLGFTVQADDGPDAKAELTAAIDLLKTRHMNSSKVDWPAVQAKALDMLGDAMKPEEAYPAIRYVIAQLGEKHTFMITADGWKAMSTGAAVGKSQPPDWQPPEGLMLEGGIGLVTLKGYQGSVAGDLAYAGAVRNALRGFADRNVCRYIIDLRSNSGGSMDPMINGVEALLGKPPYGFWQPAGGVPESPWILKRGSFQNEAPVSETAQSRAAVAVLIDRRTASAGEDTAMAFEGRPNTRIFGENSAGFLTTNTPAALPDGARLIISGGWATDRLHRSYRDVIAPDQATPRGQATLDTAIAWLKSQPCP